MGKTTKHYQSRDNKDIAPKKASGKYQLLGNKKSQIKKKGKND